MKQVATTLGDAEYNQFERALSKAGESSYRFVKEAVLKYVEEVLVNERSVPIEDMITALKDRKWTLYQFQDYSDRNHISWLATRFPETTNRERQEALHRFRMQQAVKP